LQVAIEDLARAFQAFFRRLKAGEEPGYPRFKSDKRWRSIGFKQYGNGFKVDDRRLKVPVWDVSVYAGTEPIKAKSRPAALFGKQDAGMSV
jgi:transposase